MSTKTYPYGAQAAAKINPKMLEASGYGEFKYMKQGDVGFWKFDTEKGRNKFLKDYAGLDAKEASAFDDMAYYATQVGGMVFMREPVTMTVHRTIKPPTPEELAFIETPEFKAFVADLMDGVMKDMQKMLGITDEQKQTTFAVGGVVKPRRSWLVGES